MNPNGLALQLRFDNDIPTFQETAALTRAVAGAQPHYTVWLYRYWGEEIDGSSPDYTYSFDRSSSDLDTTVFLPVDPARYRVAAWVDWVAEEPCYERSNPQTISMTDGYPSWEHARDAFAFTADYDIASDDLDDVSHGRVVTLTRPVAQLRFVAPEGHKYLSLLNLDASALEATLRYTSAVPDGYDLLEGTVSGTRSDIVLRSTPRLDASGALVFLSDFLLSTDEGTSVSVDFLLKDKTGKEIAAYQGEVSLQRGQASIITFAPPVPIVQGDPFKRMTNAKDLQDGDEILFVYEPGSVAMGAQKGAVREAVPVQISDGVISHPIATVQVLGLETGPFRSWYCLLEGGYFATGHGSKAELVTDNEKSNFGRWYFYPQKDGTCWPETNQGLYLLLGYDPAGKCFFSMSSTSSGEPVSVFYRRGDLTKRILVHKELGCYTPLLTRSYQAGTDQHVSIYGSSSYMFALMNPVKNEQWLVSGMTDNMQEGDVLTVHMSWKKGTSNKIFGIHYMTVVKMDDGKVWLADESGNGFVIKK